MKMTLAQMTQSKWSLPTLVAALIALPNLGKGLDALGWLIGAPTVAYAAKSESGQVKEQFERYIERQDAVAEALNNYVAQQQRQQYPLNAPAPEPQLLREEDAQGCWECWGYGREDCFANKRWERCE